MKKKSKLSLYTGAGLLAAFILWTITVSHIDVKPIGPYGSSVGLATINGYVHELIGVHMSLYTITDTLGLIPIGIAFGFGILGLVQWIKRKQLKQVDYSILILGGFYIAVIALFILFEKVIINYRPVLICGYLEASYPSSTTMLVMCVMPTAQMQLRQRIKSTRLSWLVTVFIAVFTAFTVVGRLICGVHWLSDIIGGALLSCGLVTLYYYFSNLKKG